VDAWVLPVAGIAAGMALVWLALVAALWMARPAEVTAREVLRLLPDVLRLLRRLAGDPTLPRGVRVRIWLVIAYLAMPIDIVPDFLPVVGYADDVIVVAVGLRAAVRRAGPAALSRHWPGSPAGLRALHRLAGVPTPPAPPD
jgi:uncharacterized membrane protein YkvA (DUF1232 family)